METRSSFEMKNSNGLRSDLCFELLQGTDLKIQRSLKVCFDIDRIVEWFVDISERDSFLSEPAHQEQSARIGNKAHDPS